MYVLNIKDTNIKTIKVNGIIANWLMTEKSIPLLSHDKGEFLFADTELLQEVINSIPFYLKLTKFIY